MCLEPNKSLQIQDIIGLKPQHFADLIRTAQLVFDPAAGLSGRNVKINWEDFGIPDEVADNLREIGQEYQYASPHIPPEIVWSKLTTASRVWFIENKDILWRFEEIFPALDED
ncbi:hypothetical protein A0J48_011820 [Sphaerospermopsis aphanizomenoides BCCUSP55]|uniref:hypothetical protein n=1 Tax=Sphaerospermopsis aphanizomenoides TaxID=459663 RepID=UPI000A482E8D|nr:hypothetical protein [Sphaerospermopsis aphanizomenoides]MBK1988218.1 hypothetical protein [Sphaerospermopsis aphanizomenoides BCCUSP55]